MFKYTFLVTSARLGAKTVTYRFPEQLEDREVEAIIERLGEVAQVAVTVPS